MKIVAVVPIKLNNERLPNKNILILCGKPLISYICDTLLSVAEITERYVFCSSDLISQYLPLGIQFLKRSDYLDLPTSNFSQIFSEFIKLVPADIYVYAHATAPFVKATTIKKEIEAVSSKQYDSSFCAQKLQDFIWKDGEALNFDANNVPRSQDLPVFYRETSGVYVFTRNCFEIYGRRIGKAPYIVEIGYKESVDINTLADFKFAEHMMNFEEE